MPKKKPIDKRLNKLFDEIQHEDPNAKTGTGVHRETPAEKSASSPAFKPAAKSRRLDEPVSASLQTDTALALDFQTGPNMWATLQVLDETNERKWTEDDQVLVRQVTDQLTLALENARLFQQEQYRRRVADTLSELARIASSSLNLQDVAQKLLEQLPRLVSFGTASIQIIEPDGRRQQIGGISRDPDRMVSLQEPSAHFLRKVEDDPLISKIVRSREIVVINDTHNDPRWEVFPETESVHAWLGAPLLAGADVVGILILDDQTPHAFTAESIELVGAFTPQAAVAIQNARLFQETQTRAEDLSILNEMGTELSSKLDPRAIAEVVYRYTSRLMDTTNFYIALYDENKDEKSYPLAYENGQPIEIESQKVAGRGFTDYIIRNKRAVFAPSDVLGVMKKLGIEFVPLSDDLTPSQAWLGVPMLVGNRILGVLSVQSVQTPNLYDEHDRELLTAIASQAAIALENARLFQESQRRAQEMSALAEVGREISATLDLKTVLERIAEYAIILLDAVTSAVYLPDAEFKTLIPFAVTGEESEEIMNDPLQVGTGILGSIAAAGAGEIINDVSKDARAITIKGTAENVPDEHLMAVPIKVKDRVTGLMAIWRVGKGTEFNETEFNFLANLSQQAAVAIENARLFEETQSRANELSILNEFGKALAATLNVEEIVEITYSGIARLFRAENFYLALYEPQTNEIVFPQNVTESQVDRSITRLPLGDGITSHMIRTRESILITDGTDEWMLKRGLKPVGEPAKSFLGVPLVLGNKVLGALAIQDYKRDNAYNEYHLRLLTSFASQAAVAIENARLFQEVTSSQAQLSEALRIAHIGYFEIDWSATSITFTDELFGLLNTSAEREGGYTLPLETALEKFVVAEDIAVATQAVQNAIAAESDESGVTSEVRYKTTDGRIIWVSSTYKVERDERGNPIKIAGSAQDITDRKTNELTQAAITHISESALTSNTAAELFAAVHESIQTILPAKNFYAALYDRAAGMITFPYHVDELDDDWAPRKLGRGLTGYVIRSAKPLRATPEILADLEASGEIVLDGVPSVDWLGVPLRSGGTILGIMAVQTYDNTLRITEKHVEHFALIAGQTAAALERLQAREELAKSEADLRALFAAMEDVILVYDREGRYVRVAPTNPSRLFLPPQEMIGRKITEVLPESLHKPFMDAIQGTLASGETSKIEYPLDLGGRVYWFDATLSKLNEDQVFWVARDITERKLAEDVLQRRNTYLAASAEIGRLVTSTLDLNTIFTRTVNLISDRLGFYFAAIYQLDEEGFHALLREGTGGAGENMKIQRHRVAVGSQTIIGKAAQTGEAVLANEVENEPLYQPNPLLLDTRSEIAIPLKVGGRILGIIDIQSTQPQAFTTDDISVLQSLADQVAVAINNATLYDESQKLIRNLKEVDQLKSQFLANMSHELRTPLNSIIGFSRVILKGIDGPVTDMQQQDLTAIYNSGQHLLGLINDILDLARIEAGKMELNFEEVRLSEMVHSVFSTAKGLVKEKPIKLIEKVPPDMPTVRGDTMRVRQVLLNLISNASKFTDEGSITVETTVQEAPNGKLEALISVIDTGPGISPEGQAKLFKAFSQVDGSATRKSGGSGLGLSICANLVQLHGGRIGVTSEEGKGSTFWFTIPLFKQPLDEIPAGKKVVLAIDDDPQVINLYERYLNPQGYHVVPLTEPARAKERVKELKPFAVTLDIMMPNIDGWTVLTELKSDPATRDTPIIICSIVEQTDKGFNLGASDYLLKPIVEEDLVRSLDRLNRNGAIQRVLVIDDDPNDLRLIEKILTEHGRYKAILAEGGRKGWEILNANPPDAVILDIFMPDMDGFTILERLRDEPALQDLPVLVISGGGLTNEQQRQLSDYGQRLIAKGSLKEDDLIASIENALKRIGD
jgi:PAS domain S-box-containing protein